MHKNGIGSTAVQERSRGGGGSRVNVSQTEGN